MISPNLSVIQENKITEYIENASYQALTQNELKEREGVCQRIERILKDGGLPGRFVNSFAQFYFNNFLFQLSCNLCPLYDTEHVIIKGTCQVLVKNKH